MWQSRAQAQMLQGALKFVRQLFGDKITDFYLKDHSKITCNKNIKIPLYYYYLSKYGKTWYQSKVKARLVEKEDREHLKNCLHFMKSNDMLNFDEFFERYFKGCRIKGIDELLKPYYIESTSYQQFFKKVIENNDCGILESWFSRFWANNCRVTFGECLWKIRIKDIDTWDPVKLEEQSIKPKFRTRRFDNQDGGFYPYGNKPFVSSSKI